MKKEVTLYVEFVFHGFIFCEYQSFKIAKRDKTAFTIPEDAIGYRYFDIEEILDDAGEVISGQRINESPITYFGKEFTAEEAEVNFPFEQILLSNIRTNHYKRICLTRFGKFIPLREGDIVVQG